jgi:excisionase family DNA binding protein
MKHVFLSEEELTALLQGVIRPLIREELATLQTKKPADNKPEYRSRREVSEILGISLPTLGDYVKTGKLLAYRIGRRVRFKLSEVESAMKVIQTGLPIATNNQNNVGNGVRTGVTNARKTSGNAERTPKIMESSNDENDKTDPLDWV